MKRECLLSKSYTGAPMKLGSAELFYSPLVNEILRELGTAFFTERGGSEQTEHLGMVEGVLIMWMVATGAKSDIQTYLELSRPSRNSRCVRFNLENEEEIEALKPAIIARMEAAMSAAVESEGTGKSQSPRQDSLP